MLKHDRLIKKMTRQQKVALLTDPDALSGVEAGNLGIPSVKSASLSKLAERNGFPSYESLAVSWDTQLTENISCALAAESRRASHTNLYITPDLKCAANAYVSGLSEDACLNGTMGAAIARGVHADGSACALSTLSCTASDVRFLDVREDTQAVHNLFCRPFLYAAGETPCEAVISSLLRPCGGYEDVNIKMFEGALSGEYGKDAYVISESLSEDVNFQGFISSGACIRGAGITIDRAIGRYEALSKSVANGSISQIDFQNAIETGIAINPETVDSSVNRAIDFACAVNQLKPTATQTQDINKLGMRAAVESIVLLKNNGVLPLEKGRRVAAIGRQAEQFKTLSGLNVTATAEGFPDNKDDAAVKENAARAASEADVLVVFLDCEKTEDGALCKLSLPLNLLSLVERLKYTGKCLIGVLPSNVPVDMSFDADFSAILTAPYESRCFAAALGAVIEGRESPVGRLARSYYYNADYLFKCLREDLNSGIIKVGGLCGYRLNDASREKSRYAFGYGLSYTSFAYSGLRVNDQSVSFTIKNVGKCAGYEVAQLYISEPHVGGAQKELKAFTRVYLKAGERRDVTVNLPPDCLKNFDVMSKTSYTLSGIYKIYVGASASDIRLRGVLKVNGDRTAAKDGQKTEKNLAKELSCHLSAENGKSVRKNHRWVRNVFLVLLLAALAAFVAIGALAWANDEIEDYYSYFFIMGGVFALSAIVLIAEGVSHKNAVARKTNSASVTVAFKSPVLNTTTTQEVFERAFGGVNDDKKENGKNKFDEPKYLDRDFTFGIISKELETYIAERGCKISAENVRRLVSAFAASRAIIYPSEAERQMNRLAAVLSGYLGSELYASNNDIYGGLSSASVLARAIKAAEKTPEKMYIMLYRQITADALRGMVFAKTFDHASRLNKLGKQGDFIIPPNLWIIAVVAEGESVSNLSSDIAESVSLMTLEMTEVNGAARATAVRPLGFYQFDNLCGGIRGEYEIGEGMWKRIDRFEEKLGDEVFHSVGNRTWVKMEKFAATYLACGGDETEALDGAVASQLLVALQTVLYDKNISSEELLSTLEEIFGEDNINYCRKIVRTYFNGFNGGVKDADTAAKGDKTL